MKSIWTAVLIFMLMSGISFAADKASEKQKHVFSGGSSMSLYEIPAGWTYQESTGSTDQLWIFQLGRPDFKVGGICMGGASNLGISTDFLLKQAFGNKVPPTTTKEESGTCPNGGSYLIRRGEDGTTFATAGVVLNQGHSFVTSIRSTDPEQKDLSRQVKSVICSVNVVVPATNPASKPANAFDLTSGHRINVGHVPNKWELTGKELKESSGKNFWLLVLKSPSAHESMAAFAFDAKGELSVLTQDQFVDVIMQNLNRERGHRMIESACKNGSKYTVDRIAGGGIKGFMPDVNTYASIVTLTQNDTVIKLFHFADDEKLLDSTHLNDVYCGLTVSAQ